jgi:acetyltransferase-like isoleucine patch superfamily enzyme
MNWKAARAFSYAGESWGQKDVEFQRYCGVPAAVPEARFAVVVGVTGGAGEAFPRAAMEEIGWRVLEPYENVGDWVSYKEFIRASAGEFSVAKETYVKAWTGWFSCRSACYLASGRPVVAQETGWSRYIPSGAGLYAFSNVDEATDALHRIARDPISNARAAREVAENYFDSNVVLGALLAEVGVWFIDAPNFFPLIPGSRVPGDWFSGVIPTNIQVGADTLIDSAFCFKQFFSKRHIGLRVGSHVTFWRTSFAAEERGMIEVGDNCYLANASLVCADRITIGSRVVVAGGVTVADSDFHPLTPALRIADVIALSPVGDRSRRPSMDVRPVVIEDDVWVGYNATILKGVRVGSGAVIAPGAVVIRDVLAGSYVGGNPAVVLQSLATEILWQALGELSKTTGTPVRSRPT